MFTKYIQEGDRQRAVAKIYSQNEHTIKNSQIDRDALWAIRKLQAEGFEAYIVGGAVRDILLGRAPKDFDIATSASPRQVQKIFWNARIIGRRFRIVHLYFNHDKIIEVTTFRSDEENFEEGNNNIYGTIEQDSKRRDFSINSLYYNPRNYQLVDFNNALEDFRKKRIRSLIPLSYSFTEDPVRMIRAIKYHITTGFDYERDVKKALKKNRGELEMVSTSRMTEEVNKILSSGCAYEIFNELKRFKMLAYIIPSYSIYIGFPEVEKGLKELDEYVRSSKKEGQPSEKSQMYFFLFRSLITLPFADSLNMDEKKKEVFRQLKIFLSPMTPPNYELERTASLILQAMGYKAKVQKKAVAASSARKKPGATLGRRSAAAEELSKSKRKKSGRARNIVKEEVTIENARSLAESHDV